MKKMRIIALVFAILAIISMVFMVSCKKKKSGDPCASGNHQWTKWKPNGDETCTEDGTQTRTCPVCKASETQPAPGTATDHFFIDYKYVGGSATCTTDGIETAICHLCEEASDTRPAVGSAFGHRYDPEPVSTYKGYNTFRCLNCDEEHVIDGGIIDENFDDIESFTPYNKLFLTDGARFELLSEGEGDAFSRFIRITRSGDKIIGSTAYGMYLVPDYDVYRNGSYVIEYSIRVSETTQDLDLLVGKKMVGEHIFVGYDSETRKLEINGIDHGDAFVMNEWTKITVVLDDIKQRYDVYVNNTLVAAKMLYGDNFPGAAELSWFCVRMAPAPKTASNFDIDNIKTYLASELKDTIIPDGMDKVISFVDYRADAMGELSAAQFEAYKAMLSAHDPKNCTDEKFQKSFKRVLRKKGENMVAGISWSNFASGYSNFVVKNFVEVPSYTISIDDKNKFPHINYGANDELTYEVYDLSEYDSITIDFYCADFRYTAMDGSVRDTYKVIIQLLGPTTTGASYYGYYYDFKGEDIADGGDGWQSVTIPIADIKKNPNRNVDIRAISNITISAAGWGSNGVGAGVAGDSSTNANNAADGVEIIFEKITFNKESEYNFVFAVPNANCDHDYEIINVSPTCTMPGYTVERCKKCGGEKVIDYIIGSVEEHDWEVIADIAPNCDANGFYSRKCLVCNKKERWDILPNPHDFIGSDSVPNEIQRQEGTCTQDGFVKQYCDTCQQYIVLEFIPQGHNFQLTWDDNTKFIAHICSRCNEVHALPEGVRQNALPSYEDLIKALDAEGSGYIKRAQMLNYEGADRELDKLIIGAAATNNGTAGGSNLWFDNDSSAKYLDFILRSNNAMVKDNGGVDNVGRYVRFFTKEKAGLADHPYMNVFPKANVGASTVFEFSLRLGAPGKDGKYSPGGWAIIDRSTQAGGVENRAFGELRDDGSLHFQGDANAVVQFSDKKFTHVALVFRLDSGNKLDIYVDGVLVKLGMPIFEDAYSANIDFSKLQIEELRLLQLNTDTGLGSYYDVANIAVYESNHPAFIIGADQCSMNGQAHVDVNAGKNYGDEGWDSESGIVTNPTCNEPGYTTFKCANCGLFYQGDFTNATGHTDVNEGKTEGGEGWDNESTFWVDSTCTEKGHTVRKCKDCGIIYKTDYADALGHDYEDKNGDGSITIDDYTVIANASCTEVGKAEAECRRCQLKDVMEIAKVAHNFDTNADGAVNENDFETVSEPTCSTTGLKKRSCVVCGYVDTRTIPVVDHTYDGDDDDDEYDISRVVAATCETPEKIFVTCIICGDESSFDGMEAIGHNFSGEFEILRDPDCVNAGEKFVICQNGCGLARTETIDALGHDFIGDDETENEKIVVIGDCYNDGYVRQHCDRCNIDVELEFTPKGHKYELGLSDTLKALGYICQRGCNEDIKVDTVASLPTYTDLIGYVNANSAIISRVDMTDYGDDKVVDKEVVGPSDPDNKGGASMYFLDGAGKRVIQFLLRSNKLVVKDNGGADDVGKYVRFYGRPSEVKDHAYVNVNPNAAIGKSVVLEFSLRLGAKGADGNYFNGSFQIIDRGTTAFAAGGNQMPGFATMQSDGSLILMDGSSIIRFNENSFTHVALAFRIEDGNKLDVYIDGVLTYVGVPVFANAQSSICDFSKLQIDEFRILQTNATVGYGSAYDIANIAVYESDHPAFITGTDYCTIKGESHIDVNDGKESGDEGWDPESGVVIQPTCTDQGYTAHKCATCGQTYKTDTVPAIGHDYDTNNDGSTDESDYTLISESTCLEKGVMHATCKNCGVTDVLYLDTLKHDYDTNEDGVIDDTDYTVTLDPTCLAVGKKEATCMRGCGTVDVQDIAKLAHIYDVNGDGFVDDDDYTQTLAPDCVNNGSKEAACQRGCGVPSVKPIPALGHMLDSDDPDNDPDIIKDDPRTYEATCMAQGQNLFRCWRCDYEETRPTPIVDHNYDLDKDGNDDWFIVTEAECGVEGLRTKTCTMCQVPVEEVIPALEHDWVLDDNQTPIDCLEGGTRSYTCSLCETPKVETVDAPGHLFTGADWIDVTTEGYDPDLAWAATCIEDGQRYRHCLNEGCTYGIETQKISKSNEYHDYQAHDAGDYTCEKCTICGDEKNKESKSDLIFTKVGNSGYMVSGVKEGVEYIVIPAEYDGLPVISVNTAIFDQVKGVAVYTADVFVDYAFAGIELEYLIIGADITEIPELELDGTTIGTLYYRGAEGDLYIGDIIDEEEFYVYIDEFVYDYDGEDIVG